MSKEESTLIVDLIDLTKRSGYTITITKNGSVIREVRPSQPFAVKDGEVHMQPARVDDEAIGRDVIAKLSYLSDDIAELRAGLTYISQRVGEKPRNEDTFFYPRKHLGDTFDEAQKSWRDDIASASSEESDNLKVDVESIKAEGALTPDDVAQAYLETIGETAGPLSGIVISIGTMNVNVN